MKRLFLLRHALALPAQNNSDIDRALAPKGLEDAQALGRAMAKAGYTPDLVLCSDAKRTRMTCEAVLAGLAAKSPQVQFSKALYDARRGDLLYAIQSADDQVGTLMLVGHNPAIYELAAMLASSGPERMIDDLGQGYLPATFCAFDVPFDHWAKIDPDACAISALLTPLDYNAPERPTRWM